RLDVHRDTDDALHHSADHRDFLLPEIPAGWHDVRYCARRGIGDATPKSSLCGWASSASDRLAVSQLSADHAAVIQRYVLLRDAAPDRHDACSDPVRKRLAGIRFRALDCVPRHWSCHCRGYRLLEY